MKIINYLLIGIMVLFYSCNKITPSVEEPKVQFCIRPNLQLALDSFINEVKPLGKVNEIYVDKVKTLDYETIIFSGEESLSERGLSPFFFEYKGITFYLYSGLEHYFDNCQKDTLFDDRQRKEGSTNGTFWIVLEKDDSIKIKKDEWAIPYYSMYYWRFPQVKFDRIDSYDQ